MPLRYIGRTRGFPSRTFDEIYPSKYVLPFLNGVPNKRRSPVTQKLIIDDLKQFDNSSERPVDPVLDLAIAHATRKFMLPSPVKMKHLNDVFRMESDIWTKSPGLPWTNYGVKTKGQIRDDPERVREVRKFWHYVKAGDKMSFPDCCAFVRSHVCEVDEFKVRAVWGYPATITFGEAVFATPLIEAYQSLPSDNTPVAYGLETATGGMRRIKDRFVKTGLYYAGLDFSKFDKTIPAWLIRIAFDILRCNIDFTYYQDHGIADARRMIVMYEAIVDYFINTPVRTALGLRYRKNSGIASGSYFTQLVGSIVNCILLYYACLQTVGRMPFDSVFLGDDSFLSTSRPLSIGDIAACLSRFGVEINTKKSQVSSSIDEMRFLGYCINHTLPYKPADDLLTSLAFPERPDESWDDAASRALGIYYANFGMNSDVSEICWKMVNVAEFNLTFGRGFERMLKHVGYTDLDKHLPAPVEFLRRLSVFC
uniref:RNA-dependent RNA polymerase n=1 Tax=Pennypacker partiti-like virus TaxID=2716653 RepID=A0A6G7PS01_9VIRU|nr:RNA-dependent RNA polymerase [Pennypacker partiti-like virus]